jgi:tetratricopeptide (TPR) repeat protein
VDAEASIVKSDWKSAQAKLEAWLPAHPTDSRALFDAGYVADAQNRLDDAAGLYRRAVEANPKSFEAHLSLGLLLARQGKPEEARPELAAATQLDPGDAGPAMKARAWRALAQIDRPRPGTPGDTTKPPTICSKPSSSLLKRRPTHCSPPASPTKPAHMTSPRKPTAASWPRTPNPPTPTPAWPTF